MARSERGHQVSLHEKTGFYRLSISLNARDLALLDSVTSNNLLKYLSSIAIVSNHFVGGIAELGDRDLLSQLQIAFDDT